MQVAGFVDFFGALVRVGEVEVRVVGVLGVDWGEREVEDGVDDVARGVGVARVAFVVRPAAAEMAPPDAEDMDDADPAPPEQAASASTTGRAAGARRRRRLTAGSPRARPARRPPG
ncbi:hypothetical protein [Allobranchiibius sp. CTAmp26]|uniref:hypothetical protein n=1 Tax=Allobranchiibius sp. CTAmp26 TaxID=2815214 RepID=UPI001AA181F6|nr:hypothetical protein [Allobranchiibius sp. CTAmp26]MBO1754183.1 hypothetical protein [Allobranchiibius sp. CTAmp26]